MSNRILDMTIHDHSVTPATAEVWVTVVPERLTPTTEVRGRLMGPRCPYASTVEVAYPLRPLPQSHIEKPSPASLTRRVVMPEASLWEPESPFLYEGPVELWQDGQRCDRRIVRHGLRTISLGPQGLLVNGRPLLLRGSEAESSSEEQVRARRGVGDNLIIGPVVPGAAAWWDAADRLGMLALGCVQNAEETTEKLLGELSRHPSCLGWVLEGDAWDEARQSLLSWVLDRAGGGKVGVELARLPKDALPRGNHFILCPSEDAALYAASGLPLLLRGESQETVGGLIIGVLNKRPGWLYRMQRQRGL
jgi:hypothetical protein